MRLDKFLSLCGKASRSETLRSVRRGEITVNGVPARRGDCPVEPDTDTVVFRGETVVYRPYTYVMLHKPDGVVSATEDRLAGEPTVLDLLPPELTRLRPGLFPCGRLDKHTTGLMLLTNNGKLAHRLLSPARHVDKNLCLYGEVSAVGGGCCRTGVRREPPERGRRYGLRNGSLPRGADGLHRQGCRRAHHPARGQVPPDQAHDGGAAQSDNLARAPDLRSAGAGSRARARRVAPADRRRDGGTGELRRRGYRSTCRRDRRFHSFPEYGKR
ncbi:MAG: pseudouridine synthase [Oscillospiraceae bacterium]|nr:MAG: pseudouridine synthase [Oscillospiraceae bacterium]